MTNRSGELRIDGGSFAFGLAGPTADILDPTAETLTVFAIAGNVAILSSIISTSGGTGVLGYTDQACNDLIDSFAREPLNLDLELLVASAVSVEGPGVEPVADQSVTVLDGQSLPQDGEAAGQLDFRLLTDVGTIHALRTTLIVESSTGPVNIVQEVRGLGSEQAAFDFFASSQGRVTTFSGRTCSPSP